MHGGGGGFTFHERFAACRPEGQIVVLAGTTWLLVFLGVVFVWGFVAALIAGAVAAMFMAVVSSFGVLFAPRPPLDLPYADRLEVVRSVARGEVTTDARLAPAVVAYAMTLRRRSVTNPRNRWIIAGGLALFCVMAVIEAREGRWANGVANIVPMLGVVALSAAGERRQLARADAAREAAEGLLGQG